MNMVFVFLLGSEDLNYEIKYLVLHMHTGQLAIQNNKIASVL